jgi:hypothetical protein
MVRGPRGRESFSVTGGGASPPTGAGSLPPADSWAARVAARPSGTQPEHFKVNVALPDYRWVLVEDIAFFTVLAEVQALPFLVRRDAQTK